MQRGLGLKPTDAVCLQGRRWGLKAMENDLTLKSISGEGLPWRVVGLHPPSFEV